MKEYSYNRLTRIVFATLSLSMVVLVLWIILNIESTFDFVVCIAMLVLSSYLLIDTFVHKIFLDENSITEKSLIGNKQIIFQEITHIGIDSILTEIKSGKRKIKIGKLNFNDYDQIMGTVISKIKDNENLLFAGDPIIFQSYINEFSDNNLFTAYYENDLTNFTFVQNAELLEKRRLFRVVKLTTSKGDFKIMYFGKGMGYQCVFVNDELVLKKDSHFWYVPENDELVSKKDSILWYVPEFDFNYKGVNFSVKVRVYPWLTIRKFWIEVDKKIVYSE